MDIINIPLMETRLQMYGDFKRLSHKNQAKYHNCLNRIALAKDDEKNRLFCIQFDRNYTELSVIDGVETSSQLWEVLKPRYPYVVQVLDALANCKTLISLWFLATPSLDDFCRKSFAPFEHAVRHRLPTLYQYLNQKGEPDVDFVKTEKIDKFKGGMYAKYPMMKVGNKKVTNTNAEPTSFYTLPEKALSQGANRSPPID